MCNDYEQHVVYADYQKAVRAVELEMPSSESSADLPQADDIKIGDLGPVLVAHGNGAKLVLMRFGFPPPRPKAGPSSTSSLTDAILPTARGASSSSRASSSSPAQNTPRQSTGSRSRARR